MIRSSSGKFLKGTKMPPRGTPEYIQYRRAYNQKYYAKNRDRILAQCKVKYRNRLGGMTKREIANAMSNWR